MVSVSEVLAVCSGVDGVRVEAERRSHYTFMHAPQCLKLRAMLLSRSRPLYLELCTG